MRILITAGPTREPIDAVRYIGNRSSGTMGIALADAALRLGHAVTLLMGPGPRDEHLPKDAATQRFESTADLRALLDVAFDACDLLIMAAAVADYRPANPVEHKLARQPGKALTIEMESTPDLVGELCQRKRADQCVVAFALESPESLEARASAKMQRKGVDAIVANPLVTMEAGRVEAVLLTATGERFSPGAMSKADFADWLMAKLPCIAVGAKLPAAGDDSS